MMNTNEEDIDLRLALGSRSYSAETRLNNTRSGAGVNAISRVDMPFAASDPLAELVWSPHSGLSLKCSNFSLPDSRRFPTWNLGETTNVISPSVSVRSKGSGDIRASDVEKLNVATMLDGSTSTSARQRTCDAVKMEIAGTTDAIQEEYGKGNAEVCSSQNVQIAERSKRSAEQDSLFEGAHDRKVNLAINLKSPSNLLIETRFNQKETRASRSDIMGLAIPESHGTKVSEALGCSLPNLQVQKERGEEVTSASGNLKNKTKVPISIPPPTLMRLESFDENDLSHLAAKEALPRENPHDAEREKGKGRASSDGATCARSSNGEDDSHESVESCSSAGLWSKGLKRPRYDQGQLIGTKRARSQTEGSHGPTSFVRSDSSFMNWISNMVKGRSDSNKEDPSPLPLALAHSNNVISNIHRDNLMCDKTTDSTRPIMGFQTVFQSLYCRSTMASDTRVHKDNQSLAESRGLVLADNKSLENLPHINSCKLTVLEQSGNNRGKGEVSTSDSLSEKAISTADKTSLDIPLPLSCIPGKSSPFSSLWITRLYTRTSRSENCNLITEKPFDCSSDSPNINFETRENDVLSSDQKISKADSAGDEGRGLEQELQSSSPKMTPIQSSEKLTSSEALVSIFAKRLDALRHIIYPSEKRKSPSCELVCFFCGRSEHDLRTCPELTETELENLLVKISSFHRVEESSCLCIRCFQIDHWAISCPLLSSDDHEQVVSRQEACSKKPILGSFPSILTWDVNEASRKMLSSSNEFQKSTSSSEHHLKDKQIFPPCDFVNPHHAVQQEEVFHAIRKLRLSRADILRWMSSNISLSHLNGFFLRFRLGKVKGCLGGTCYYVACITENVDCKSMKSILVDAGGIKSSVGSQYISNHEFLEDEIKAWWSRIVKTGGKIPSIDELNSKLESRKCLGF